MHFSRYFLLRESRSSFRISYILVPLLIGAMLFFSISSIILKKKEVIYILDIPEKYNSQPYTVNKNFLSIALDTVTIANELKGFNTTDPKLIKMMKALSPAFLRIGGTLADKLIFSNKKPFYINNFKYRLQKGHCQDPEPGCELDIPNFFMSAQEWHQINKLAKLTGLEIIFDLNALQRNTDGSWNEENARKLIKFSNKQKYKIVWELGNEPNSFRHKFNVRVDPQQLAEDYRKLRRILNEYRLYNKNTSLIGPDVTRLIANNKNSQIFLKTFLTTAKDVVHAVTTHHYYLNGRIATAADFMNPNNFDALIYEIQEIKDVMLLVDRPNKPTWLGETSSAYGGGAPGLSDRFIATFIWLDKLGISAKMGIDVVVRQTIFEGFYSLLDKNYNPRPDWWVSILYKKLVGTKVLQCGSTAGKYIRLYCHCSTQKNSIIVYGMNLLNSDTKIRVEGILPMKTSVTPKIYVDSYILSSNGALLGRKIYLNGKLLKLDKYDDIPPLIPNKVPADHYLVIPPSSLVFWDIPINTSNICD